ncbi:esterase family protein [Cytobacillus horneckiae]|uniref:Esterase family protein n=1 Tax=Cytobacillus horneckiae TaxID=549687 RepID=A0A2N0ZF73_9BACI|nr:esterase family protein [Cytobacillus horneckiae]MEC1155617.1 esterase family protein [Cytobacillus horneckiae]MED2936936.1 esterase family protein [Cytobacillus horneckiae]PKG28171.1 esterase family protein [Cytobacillus horneckiae]
MNIPKGTITDFTFSSKVLGEDLDILVYLPGNYSPLYKYNLLIAQDGKDYFQLGRIGRTADDLLQDKEIENTIIIGIPYKSVEDRRKKYHPEGEQHEAYVRFLAHELVPYLDEKYPTYQMGMGRALIGDSLGATVSLLTALQYPHTFGTVILQSPLVNEKVMAEVENFKPSHLLNIYHVIGKGETVVKTTEGSEKDFLTPNRKLSDLMKSKGFPYFYDEFDGDHTWTHWQPDLKRALKQML